MAAPGKGLIFGGMCTGVGLALTALGFAPATTEALPFGLGLTVFGLFFAVPGYRTLRQRLAVERGGDPAALGDDAAGPPSSVECPNCRGPAPLCLFKPDRSTCAYCGHQFALPAELAARLTAGAAAVKAQSDAERHIAKSVEHLALKEQSWIASMRRLARALLILAALVGAGAFAVRNTKDDWHAFFFMALCSGGLAAWLSAQARRRIPEAVQRMVGRWTALKLPNVDALCCRVCGGPLPAEHKPVLRCTFCSADNLAGAGVLARVAAGAEHARVGALKVAQRKQQGEELLAFALNAYVPAALVGWFAIGAFAGSGFIGPGGDLRIWVDPTARLALIRTEHGGQVHPCIAAFKDDPGGVALDFGSSRTTVVTKEKLAQVQWREPVAPSWFEGQRIFGKGQVEKVVRRLRWPDRHMFRVPNDTWDVYVPANFGGGAVTCLEEEVTGEAMELPRETVKF